jgi:uncharacterized protein YbjT (DUF2867 family)
VGERVIAVTGAAGKTGRAVTAALAARGATVRALVHTPEQAAAGVSGAGEAVAVDLADHAAACEALDGIAAVYLIAPNVHPDEPGLLGPVIDACARRGPRAVVYHSVIHPYAPAMPHHVDKARVEAMLAESGLDWAILQPASYFENALGVWPSVRERGVWPLPYSERTAFTPVALDDVAEVGATVLLVLTGVTAGSGDGTSARHRFATYELAGPEVLTTTDMARVTGEVLGRDVCVTVDRTRPEPASDESDRQRAARTRLRAMFDYYDAHGICGNPTVLAALLGRAPTSWRHWVDQHR